MSSVINNDTLVEQARLLVAKLERHSLRLAIAESCTGGLLSALITEIPGSSHVFDRGFVTYSNEAKTEMLGVPEAWIDSHGAVSEEIAQAMATGAIDHSSAQITVSITGIAGPGGGTDEKPVGLVYFSACGAHGTELKFHSRNYERRFGDIGRAAVRLEAVRVALEITNDMIDVFMGDGTKA